MMPDLGEYSGAVLSAYGVSLVLILGLVAVSVARARRIRAALDRAEQGRDG